MRNLKFYITVATLAAVMTSCKDEKKELADKAVNDYVTYVDSISLVTPAEATEKWDEIETSANAKKMEAENSIADVKDKTAYEVKIATSSGKYQEYKENLEAEKKGTDAIAATNADDANKEGVVNKKTSFRKSLFGGTDIGDDMNFNWVNKDNIYKVYDNFVTTVSNNKDSYSREDWDEIKLLYEALDAHKNTVEKQGLTPEDNRKIAGLKLKFAPMLKVNRMGAKADENAAAKE
jgi:DNA-directed RNA polymerase subunit F